MGDVVKIKNFKRERATGKTYCDAGFHRWEPLAERQFDVKQGKLVTVERCLRCGTKRHRLT